MKALRIALRLFDGWNKNQVRYCHWKSNEHLLEGLWGDTDLDILCDEKQTDLIEKVFRETGYLRLTSQFGSRYPGVEDWLGCDEETGRLIHIHLHYDIITGHQGMKEYSLQWTKLALETRILNETYDIYVIDPTLELILLYSRIGLKATREKINKARNNQFHLSVGDIKEIEYLRPLVKFEKLKFLVEETFIKTSNTMISLFDNDLFDGHWYLALHHCCVTDLEKWNRKKGVNKIIDRLYYYFAIRFRIYFNAIFYEKFLVKKSLGKSRGVKIAFLGQDGAGKSTVTDEVKKWLGWKVDIRKYYLGSGDHYLSWQKKLNGFLKRKNMFEILRKFISISDLSKLSRKVLKLTGEAERYTQEGGVAIFDRYPQIQYPGINDGPKIRIALNNKRMPVFMRKYLEYLAGREEKNYRKASSFAPDLVIKMILPPEVSIERKPEEMLESVKEKHEIIKNLTFANSEVLLIDATMDLNEELRMIHNAIWSCILRQAVEQAKQN